MGPRPVHQHRRRRNDGALATAALHTSPSAPDCAQAPTATPQPASTDSAVECNWLRWERRSTQTVYPGTCIETAIEAQNASCSGCSHNCHVQSVPRRESTYGADQLSRNSNFCHAKGQDVIHNRIKTLEGGIDSVKPLDGRVSVEDLLVHLNVGDEMFSVSYQLR